MIKMYVTKMFHDILLHTHHNEKKNIKIKMVEYRSSCLVHFMSFTNSSLVTTF
jgi:hypothetical protein